MYGFPCPYCSYGIPDTPSTHKKEYVALRGDGFDDSCEMCIDIYQCPTCKEYVIHLSGIGSAVRDLNIPIKPFSNAKQFPEYVPKAVRQDYEEACAIRYLSPKASATLARRCLQSIIRDFWQINENTLNASVKKLEGIIPAADLEVINCVRRIGNIGAHMEKDINLIIEIDPEEAEKLLLLIEYLVKAWYIDRNAREQLYEAIRDIDARTQAERKK